MRPDGTSAKRRRATKTLTYLTEKEHTQNIIVLLFYVHSAIL